MSLPAFPLRIREDGYRIVDAHGNAWFYMADTAWELFHRLNREEAFTYLQDRAEKSFNAVQAVILAELDGLRTPNANGDVPLKDMDPTRWNEPYFAYVDEVVRQANALGLVMALLPTWGDKWNQKWGEGPEIFTPENAEEFGRMVGERYKNDAVIWVLGGDRNPEAPAHYEIIDAMARGLRSASTHLITYHPMGGHSSGEFWHDRDWLDFNMCQSGHSRDADTVGFARTDLARTPAKPHLDGEPAYEDLVQRFWELNPGGPWPEVSPDVLAGRGFLDDADVRNKLYLSILAGSCGHTYGNNGVWQMWSPGRKPNIPARFDWRRSLRAVGAGQIEHARRLFLSRDFGSLEPLANQGAVALARCREGRYLLAYSPEGQPFSIDLAWVEGYDVARWYDPRTGEFSGPFHPEGALQPPSTGRGNDWVLVVD